MRKTILNKSLWGTVLVYMLLATNACTKKDDVTPEDEKPCVPTQTVTEGKFVLAVRSNGANKSTTDYLMDVDGVMDCEISIVGKGKELPTYHWYRQTGKYLTTVTSSNTNVAEVFKLGAGKTLESHGKFSLPKAVLFHTINETEFLAINIPFLAAPHEATIYTVDAEKADVVNQKTFNVFTPTNGSAEQALFSGMALRGNKLYLPFIPIADNKFNSTTTDTAYVAIYSYPDMVYQGRILDARTGPIGAYASDGYIFNTENDDLYTVSTTCIRNGFIQETKPSGILRIKAGEDRFDSTYFFNVEATTGYKINATYYLGGGKVLASIYTTTGHNVTDHRWKWDNCRLAVLDLNAKTVNYIAGVPVHFGGPTVMYSNHLEVYNGKVYIKITIPGTDGGIYIYEVDPVALTAKRGAKIKGDEVFGFFHLKN